MADLKLSELTAEQRIYFYESLAYHLTISVRAIWSDSELSVEEQMECVKWINEIQHGVLQLMQHLRLGTNEYDDDAVLGTIKHWVGQSKCDAINGVVGSALMRSSRVCKITE